MSGGVIRLGTRGSRLATTQSELVADRLRALGHEVELVIVRTTGDRIRGSLASQGQLGVFAAELRTDLLLGGCDLAVHSAKDLPVAPVPGLELVAFPEREDSRDVLCARDQLSLQELPAGARVGTGSPRRAAQLRALRPDLAYVDIRGNVGTRLERVAPGDLDAVVLAAAGLKRLGFDVSITQFLDLLPAPGQGALAVECRDDSPHRDVLAQLDHEPTRLAVVAERGVLAALGGGCAAPIGVHARLRDKQIEVRAGVFSLDGASGLIREASDADPSAAARAVADALIDSGAAEITDIEAHRSSRLPEFHDDLWSQNRPLEQARVLVAREPSRLSRAMEEAGLDVTCQPVQRLRRLEAPAELPSGDWLAVTSARTIATMLELGWQVPDAMRVAVVGHGTKQAAERAGIRVDLTPEGPSSAAALLRCWPAGTGRVVIPGSALSSGELAAGLRDRGWDVVPVPIYTMEPLTEVPHDVLSQWRGGHFDAVLVCSGSGARAIDQLMGWPIPTHVVALGEPTAQALRQLGVTATVAATQDQAGVVAAVSRALRREHSDEGPSTAAT